MAETSAGGGVIAVAPDGAPGGPVAASLVPVGQLVAHPGNVREDLELSAEFCASVAQAGVRVPLLVTPADGGSYRVIEGHRRLAAAMKAGLAEVPCVLDAQRAGDEAGQYLDMLVANAASHRRNLTPAQEVAALFAAHEAGASKTRLRRATGRKAEEITTALKAGGISAATRERMGQAAGAFTLDQLALIAEFDGDQVAVEKILEALRHGFSVEYVAERLRQDRAEHAEHERLRAQLDAAGTPVTDGLPEGAARLAGLTRDGEDLTPEAHATCPGRGAYFPSWSLTQPVHYCTDPEANGHGYRHQYLPPVPPGQGEAGGPVGLPDRQDEPGADPNRRLVIEGNKAWAAAAEVRKRWVAQLLTRRTAPAEVARFVAGQLLTMPEPLRLGLGTAHMKPLFAELAGQDAAKLTEQAATCQAGRLPLLTLAPIAAAYEGEMSGADASRRSTWRADKYSPCPRPDAGRYLSFLASLGYQLSVIEQAVADGKPYTGDDPTDPLADGEATPGGVAADGEPGGPGDEAGPPEGEVSSGSDPAATGDEGDGGEQPATT